MSNQTMNTRLASLVVALVPALISVRAMTNEFFNPSQPMSVVSSNITDVTLTSSGYRFTYSADGYWSASPGGPPTGRFFTVFWPNGVQAQAITAGPTLGAGANITIQRTDGGRFGLRAFTGKLLANTAGAGGSFELMPQLDGQDAFADPLMYDATGYAGNTFSHAPALSGYDAYVIHLWTDWALTGLTVVDDSPLLPAALQLMAGPPDTVEVLWPATAVGYVLEQSSGLTPATWTMVTNMAKLAGATVQVEMPLSAGSRFFRLRTTN